MGSSLVTKMETRLIRGKSVMEHEGIDYEGDATATPQKGSAEAQLELLVHRKYSLPERPDVEIERTVWAYRDRRK
ncbi:MAG: hypothetical protein AABX69_01220 [Nanoarchaeota archaeon]